MGYKRGRKVYRLVFEDPDLEGLEVSATSVSLRKVLGLVDLASLADGTLSSENLAKLGDLFDVFAGAVVSWNMEEDDGTPISPSREALEEVDFHIAVTIVTTWLELVVGVPLPKGQPSNDGSQSVEASMPMDVLSPSQAS